MKFIEVSEDALDSIKEMAEKLKHENELLRVTLQGVRGMAALQVDSTAWKNAVVLMDKVLK